MSGNIDHTGTKIVLWNRFCEFCHCCSSTTLPGPAWIVLMILCKHLFWVQYVHRNENEIKWGFLVVSTCQQHSRNLGVLLTKPISVRGHVHMTSANCWGSLCLWPGKFLQLVGRFCTYCPSRITQHHKFKSTRGVYHPGVSPCVC